MIEPGRKVAVSRGFLIAITLILSLALTSRVSRAAATTQPVGLHATFTVLSGPDAGVRIDGFLSLTSGTGAQMSGTFSTLAGTLMSQFASYNPITATATMSQTGIDLNRFKSQAAALQGTVAQTASGLNCPS